MPDLSQIPQQTQIPQQKPSIKKRDVALIAFGLAVILIAILFALDRLRNRHTPVSRTNESTTSANANFCEGKITFENQKQGFKICLDSVYEAVDETEQKIASEVTLRYRSSTSSSSARPTIKIRVTNPINRAAAEKPKLADFKETKSKVDLVDATISTYTKSTNTKIVETSFDRFRRTYNVLMESSIENFDIDRLTYDEIMTSWEFLKGTPDPPWALTGNLFVNKPWPGDSVGNPFVIEGQAKVFEGLVNIRVKDSAGNILTNTTATTSSGTTLSAFTKNITFTKASTSKGVIEVFSLSARGGTEQDKVSIPITFK